jgi:hypothetical protein
MVTRTELLETKNTKALRMVVNKEKFLTVSLILILYLNYKSVTHK